MPEFPNYRDFNPFRISIRDLRKFVGRKAADQAAVRPLLVFDINGRGDDYFTVWVVHTYLNATDSIYEIFPYEVLDPQTCEYQVSYGVVLPFWFLEKYGINLGVSHAV